MSKRSFVMGLVLAALTATVVIFANGGIVVAGPEARMAEATKGQALPEPADAGGLARIARRLLLALKAGDEIALYETLAPWQQEAEALKQQRVLLRLGEGEEEWKSFAARLKRQGLDPDNKLNLKSIESLKTLNPAQYSALMAGVYKVQADPETSKRLRGRWYAVSSATGLMTPQVSWMQVMVGGGVATLETVEGDTLVVRGVRAGSAWRVLEYDMALAEIRIHMRQGALLTSVVREAVVAEAKAALGTLKDRVRVYYVQNENTLAGANRITDYIPQAATELDGEYYSASEYHINDQNMGAVKLTADGSKADGRPKVEITFNARTGKSDGGFVVTCE